MRTPIECSEAPIVYSGVLTFSFQYIGSWDGSLELEKIEPLDTFLSNSAPQVLGLPRQLARMPGFYTGPMLLLVLTLSLSAFTASLAQTLDNH